MTSNFKSFYEQLPLFPFGDHSRSSHRLDAFDFNLRLPHTFYQLVSTRGMYYSSQLHFVSFLLHIHLKVQFNRSSLPTILNLDLSSHSSSPTSTSPSSQHYPLLLVASSHLRPRNYSSLTFPPSSSYICSFPPTLLLQRFPTNSSFINPQRFLFHSNNQHTSCVHLVFEIHSITDLQKP